jgi:hypothetical protein
MVLLTGSGDVATSLLSLLAPMIWTTGYTPVFKATSSCGGVAAILGPSSGHVLNDPAPGTSGKYATYFDKSGNAVECLLGPNGAAVDVGESNTFASSCAGYGEPGPDAAHYLGPIQSMSFVVPGASVQKAITAEVAHAIFGTGAAGGAGAPWTNPSLYFVRSATSGIQEMMGLAINVPPGSFWGIDRGSASNIDAQMRVITDPTLANQAIGFISSDQYDADRSNLNALAFQASGQDCAYLPDSSPFKKDKRNVRDGHYPIWGPIHFYTEASEGVPTSPAAQAFISLVSVPNLTNALIDAYIGANLVPTCAMTVQRMSELGQVSAYSAPFQCGCYFESKVDDAVPAGCTACASSSDCNDPKRPACNLGFCEIQ